MAWCGTFTKLYPRAMDPQSTDVSLINVGNQAPKQKKKARMTMDTNNTSTDVAPSKLSATKIRSHGRRRWLALLAIPLAGGALSVSIASAHGFGGGRGGGPMGGEPGEHMGEHTGEHMQGRIDHLLTAAGASDAQKAQVKAIWDNLRPQLKAARQQKGEIRQQMEQVLGGATIDPARVEQLRKKSVEAMDKMSVLMTQAVVASAQVLTPPQRKIVLQKLEERRHHFDR